MSERPQRIQRSRAKGRREPFSERVQPLPGYWMDETSGVLRPAIEAYLAGDPMTPEQIAAMRAYLRRWMKAPFWGASELRVRIDGLVDRRAISRWLDDAMDIGLDPL